MYFELAMVVWILLLLLFIIFWIVQEGSRWQKHPVLGGFARFIQASAGRGFAVFLLLTLGLIPSTLGLMAGFWADAYFAGEGYATVANTVPIVNTLLIMFLFLAAMVPVMWGSFRTWRQAVRSAAEVRVRTTGEM